MELTAAQRDRACGALLGTAAGDALGAGYEFARPLDPGQPVEMIGGGLGPFKPGEWTDDETRY
jgi:ADP-ribosylglycohydrolase